jgi:hypothetical protein
MIKYSSFDLTGDSEVFAELLKLAASDKDKYTSDVYNMDTGEDKTGKELIERAHPETMRVLDSYIVDGGVCENQTEQQEISIQIANKMPDNKVSRKTMATTKLLDELIIIAEEMDVRGESDLAIFADNISNNLCKTAVFPFLAVGIAAGVAALSGAYFYMVHGASGTNFGPGKNLKSVFEAIDDFKSEKLTSSYDEGSTSAENILNHIQSLVVDIGKSRESYLNTTKKLTSELQQMYDIKPEQGESGLKSKTAKAIIESPAAKNKIKEINDCNEKYKEYIYKDILPALKEDYDYLKTYFKTTEDMSESESGERSTLQQIWDSTKNMFGYAVVSAEDEVLNAIEITINSLQNDIVLREKEKDLMVKLLTNRIMSDVEFDADAKNPTTPEATPETTPTTTP